MIQWRDVLRTVILFDKQSRHYVFKISWSFLLSVEFFTWVYITFKAWRPKLGLALQLYSYQCRIITTSRVCVLNLSMRLSLLLATRLLIHDQCVSKIICRSLSVGLVLTLQHLCSIDAVDGLSQTKKLCTYFYEIQSSVMNILGFFYY